MAAAPSGLRTPDNTPRPPGGTPPGPATLAGMAGEGGSPEDAATPEGGGPGGGMQAMLQEGLRQAQQTEMQLGQLASQFPATAPALRRAQTALTDAARALQAALRQIITHPGQPEPPAPAIGG